MDTIILEKRGHIGIATLNQPDHHNAMSFAMADDFAAMIAAVASDPELRVLVINGAGPSFSAGGDLNNTFAMYDLPPAQAQPQIEWFYQRFLSVQTLEIPTIAALQGNVIGAGLCLALACDLRVAATDSRLTMSFIKLGVSPGMGATYLLPRLVGASRALELFLTGEVLNAQQALDMGLVNHVVNSPQLAEFTLDLAARIAQNAPVAARLVKKAVYQGLSKDLQSCLQYEAMAQVICSSTEDMKEGLAAIKAKRAPAFKGR